MKFPKGQSGNPGGRPKVLAEVQELARQHAPSAIAELARLALKAKSEPVRAYFQFNQAPSVRAGLTHGYFRHGDAKCRWLSVRVH